MVQLVSRHSCVADTLPVVVRFPAGPQVRLKTVDPPKGNGLGQQKKGADRLADQGRQGVSRRFPSLSDPPRRDRLHGKQPVTHTLRPGPS